MFKEEYEKPDSAEDRERSNPVLVWRSAPLMYIPLPLLPRPQLTLTEAEQYLKEGKHSPIYMRELL
jgi:hypothetical protein